MIRLPDLTSEDVASQKSESNDKTLEFDGADEASRSSKQLSLDIDLVNPGYVGPDGGRIKSGNMVGGSADGLQIGDCGTIYRHILTVAARGRAPSKDVEKPRSSKLTGDSLNIVVIRETDMRRCLSDRS